MLKTYSLIHIPCDEIIKLYFSAYYRTTTIHYNIIFLKKEKEMYNNVMKVCGFFLQIKFLKGKNKF